MRRLMQQRIGILRRMKHKIPTDKLIIIAEAIFNSVIRYGIAVYLVPTYDKEDLKARKLSSEANTLQGDVLNCARRTRRTRMR